MVKWFGADKASPPAPLLSSFRRLYEQRPLVLRRGRGVVNCGLIKSSGDVDNKELNGLVQISA